MGRLFVSCPLTLKQNNMSTNKIAVAGLIGGIVAFFLGWLVYGMLLTDFFKANGGGATGVDRAPEEMVMWAMIVGHLAFGLLVAIIFGRWASISTPATGAKAGAVLGFLVGLTALIDYGVTNISNLTGVLVNAVVLAVITAIMGAAVAWWLGRD